MFISRMIWWKLTSIMIHSMRRVSWKRLIILLRWGKYNFYSNDNFEEHLMMADKIFRTGVSFQHLGAASHFGSASPSAGILHQSRLYPILEWCLIFGNKLFSPVSTQTNNVSASLRSSRFCWTLLETSSIILRARRSGEQQIQFDSKILILFKSVNKKLKLHAKYENAFVHDCSLAKVISPAFHRLR